MCGQPIERKALAEAINVFVGPSRLAHPRYRWSGERWMAPAAVEGSLMPRWRVEMFRKRLQRLGTIDAGIAQPAWGMTVG